jgi:hypothetical protein
VIAVIPLILSVQMLLRALSLELQSSAGASETREYRGVVGEPPTGAR